MVVIEGMWLHREACVEVKESHEGGVSVRCSDKKLDDFTPKRYLGCVFNVRAFWSFVRRLYTVDWFGKPSLWGRSSHFVCERDLIRVREKEREVVL
jgi:hypothetical protein